MNARHRTVVALLIALAVVLAIAPAASAAVAEDPVVKVEGAVQITQDGNKVFSSFEAKSVGPAAGGMGHQPARGMLTYRDEAGLSYRVSVLHIHDHGAGEVHFGGVIVSSSDPSLVGKHAHVVALDGGPSSDSFSVLLTEAGMHGHAPPVAVERGQVVVKVK